MKTENTAFVTGATGFIGANLVRRLLEKGRRVKVLVRSKSNLKNIESLPIEIVTGDLRDADSLAVGIENCSEVYHVAAEYSFWSLDPKTVYSSNVGGTQNLLSACEKARIPRIVYCSTVGTMGLANQPLSGDEKTPLADGQVTSHYKRSKLEAEKIALSFAERGVPVVIVNPSAPIGPWDRKPTPTGKIIVDFVNGKMPAFVETGLNLIHVRDVADGHILAAERGVVGQRYILGNQNMSLSEILRMLSEITGLPAPKFKIPYAFAFTAGWVSTKLSDWVTHAPPAVPLEAVKMARRYMYFDASKARRELEAPQTPVKKAMEDAVKWFAENQYFMRRSNGNSTKAGG